MTNLLYILKSKYQWEIKIAVDLLILFKLFIIAFSREIKNANN